MEMVMILLLCSMAQLVSPKPTAPQATRSSLNDIIDLVNNKTVNLTREFFVEDVQQLVDEGCKDVFFCKVKDILKHHGKEEDIVQRLGGYIRALKVNCAEVLKNVAKSEVSKPITELLKNLKICSQRRNTGGMSRSTTTS